MTEVAVAGGRRSADDRRRQLIGIGLGMLIDRPWHQITVDAVAQEAGISRGLLFHYFPTKQDYYAQLVHAASQRFLRATGPDPDAADPLASMIANFVGYMRRRSGPLVGLLRAAGQDPVLESIMERMHDELTDRVFAALGRPARSTAERLVVRSWWAMAEDLTVQWLSRDDVDQDGLDRLLFDMLSRVLDSVDAERAAGHR
ncbi:MULTISPECIES: TetR/AcrR family transcriptional regulator [Nocardia]|uniref:TetR family transcriptional regulator n=1 Tax=Nocardia sputorum TaxID=2984338 RepID=A0ABM8D3R2_9NOCA|nr:TetR/AcrR family transcriptional regulator [Nocardia sputorum]BDT94728.1 TetR family transcriptional regulator [Nocardia sputorum]BDU02021.1 TetR family transcriptional regulator [Nocardia sputorum]